LYSLIAVISLGIGIGASAAAFGLIRSLRLATGGIPGLDRLVAVERTGASCVPCTISYAEFQGIARRSHAFSAVAAHRPTATILREDNSLLFGEEASPNLFTVLGVRPASGRTLEPYDEQASAPSVVVISDSTWSALFKRSPTALGSQLRTHDGDLTIVGVMPPALEFPAHASYWTPLRAPATTDATTLSVSIVGRMAPGATLSRVRQELAVLSSGSVERGSGASRRFEAVPLREIFVASWHRYDLLIGAVAGCVLLMACANLACLSLLAAVRRAREFSVRTALGASRARLLGQVAVEAALLAGVGTALGILLADWGLRVVLSLQGADATLPPGTRLGLSPSVIGVACLLGLGVVIVLALLHLRVVTAANVERSLRRAAVIGSGQRLWSQGALVVGQIAGAVILLTCASLISATLVARERIDLGYDPDGLWGATLRVPRTQATPDLERAFATEALNDVRAIPGLRGTSLEGILPLPSDDALPSERSSPTPKLSIVGVADSLPAATRPRLVLAVDSSYFRTLRISIVRGRAFVGGDRSSSPAVAIVNELAARLWWHGGNPLGSRIVIPTAAGGAEIATIVGIAHDVRWDAMGGALAEPVPTLYRPFAQAPSPAQLLLTRTSQPSTTLGPVRRALMALTPDQPIALLSLERNLTESLAPLRRNALLLGALAIVGLGLCVLGVVGLVSFSVQQRAPEFAIRIALGADARRLLRTVLRQGFAIGSIGVALGIVGALAAARLLSSVLYGMGSTNPVALVSAAVVLIGLVLVATYVPARRVLSIDPMWAFRER
jgi:putative ABC transport system permease protein